MSSNAATAPGSFETWMYDSTAPSVRPARPPRQLFDWFFRSPSVHDTVVPAPDLPVLTQGVLDMTDWSRRRVARVLGTTHPTIAALVAGRRVTRVPGLEDRLRDLHAVASRVFELVGRDAARTDAALTTESQAYGASAEALITNQHAERAYLAALESTMPRPDSDLITGLWPAEVGAATQLIAEEE